MSKQFQMQLEALRDEVDSYRSAITGADDAYVLATLEEALAATKEGNFGIGAVIVDPAGAIVVRGHNQVFHPHFRSDLHAEMVAMSRFEDHHPSVERMDGYALYTSLEPCPMCWTRLITSGIGSVYYAAADPAGAMIERLRSLPPAWQELAATQTFAPARCAPELKELAFAIFRPTAERNMELLKRRGAAATSPAARSTVAY